MSTVEERTRFPNGVELGDGPVGSVRAVARVLILNPALADVDRFVTSVAMANGALTLAQTAHADGLARNVTVTVTATSTGDTQGTVTIVGLNARGEAISEVITPVAGSTVAGNKAFQSIVSATIAGWVVAAGADLIEVGSGNKLGLGVKIEATTDVISATLGGTAVAAPTVAAGGVGPANGIEGSTIDASGGTYDGAKDLSVLVAV